MKKLSYVCFAALLMLAGCKKDTDALQATSQEKPNTINLRADLLKMSTNTPTDALGIFSGVLDMKNNRVTYKLTLVNTDARVGHIHRGIFPDPGQVDFAFDIQNINAIHGTFQIAQEDALMLASGGKGLYVDVHLMEDKPAILGGQIVRE